MQNNSQTASFCCIAIYLVVRFLLTLTPGHVGISQVKKKKKKTTEGGRKKQTSTDLGLQNSGG